MKQAFNRATRRTLDKRVRKLVLHVDEIKARCELIRLSEEIGTPIIAKGIDAEGADFVICATQDGIRYGTQDDDEHCELDAYGSDGEHMFGWGGDGLDLENEVCQW